MANLESPQAGCQPAEVRTGVLIYPLPVDLNIPSICFYFLQHRLSSRVSIFSPGFHVQVPQSLPRDRFHKPLGQLQIRDQGDRKINGCTPNDVIVRQVFFPIALANINDQVDLFSTTNVPDTQFMVIPSSLSSEPPASYLPI